MPHSMVVSLRCYRITICQDIKIRRTSERGYSYIFVSSKVILRQLNFFHSCPGVTLIHSILSQVILSHLESVQLLMLEALPFNSRYTVPRGYQFQQCLWCHFWQHFLHTINFKVFHCPKFNHLLNQSADTISRSLFRVGQESAATIMYREKRKECQQLSLAVSSTRFNWS